MKNITYLLGAGASYNALPIVSQFETEIKNVISKVEIFHKESLRIYHQNINTNPELLINANNIDIAIQDLNFLLKGCIVHFSVDTFANLHFLNNDFENYKRVKNSIILFFELFSFFYPEKIDKRYDFFLSNILSNSNPKFPNNINIISWNYDYEFEKAYEKYASNEVTNCYDDINMKHKFGSSKQKNLEYCKILKINGTIGYFDLNKSITLGLGYTGIRGHGKKINNDEFSLLINTYLHKKEFFEPSISFSWENADEELINEMKTILKQTDILVIIGYSFPDFNRKIDKIILSATNRKIDKIFVQDINFYTVEKEILRFREKYEWDGTDIEEYDNPNKFFLPFEFN